MKAKTTGPCLALCLPPHPPAALTYPKVPRKEQAHRAAPPGLRFFQEIALSVSPGSGVWHGVPRLLQPTWGSRCPRGSRLLRGVFTTRFGETQTALNSSMLKDLARKVVPRITRICMALSFVKPRQLSRPLSKWRTQDSPMRAQADEICFTDVA